MTKQAEDLETAPLLGKQTSEDVTLEAPADEMSYDARKLVTFSVLIELSGTVWKKTTLWKQMGVLMLISILSSFAVVFTVQDPAKLDVSKFQKIAGFLKVVVGLLLSFFLSSSVARWYSCTNGFMELFDAIRGLHMQLNALGVQKQRVHLVLRYALVSARSLHIDLHGDAMSKDERAEYDRQAWDAMMTTDENSSVAWTNPNAGLARIYPEERASLEKCADPSQTLWIWVTSLITRMSQDGDIPPMPTPTYGKILGIAEAAYKGIREVRSSVCVQPPYVYVQMMAMLVGVNNLICAISFGMTLGTAEGTLLSRYHMSPTHAEEASSAAASRAIQDTAIALVMSTIGPFLYQALLEVCISIAQPFAGAGSSSDTAGRIDTEKLLFQLEKDLRDAEFMTENLPCWQQAYFKPPAAAAAAAK
eukprot:TRINITY_DN110784_c0_g1_i1.p1 TRINITY_DN110784_c0_g1~~TRINITY_DN110784_c0_g1_i1.p1  ORF type:complete len:419 (+),score=88.21 TRINITY_DN110784_c0_g1_i1:88-1344(+)